MCQTSKSVHTFSCSTISMSIFISGVCIRSILLCDFVVVDRRERNGLNKKNREKRGARCSTDFQMLSYRLTDVIHFSWMFLLKSDWCMRPTQWVRWNCGGVVGKAEHWNMEIRYRYTHINRSVSHGTASADVVQYTSLNVSCYNSILIALLWLLYIGKYTLYQIPSIFSLR